MPQELGYNGTLKVYPGNDIIIMMSSQTFVVLYACQCAINPCFVLTTLRIFITLL